MKREIESIRDILMGSNAVSSTPFNLRSYNAYTSSGLHQVIIPESYKIEIDYNKLAQAIYDAGYRKVGE